MKLDEMQCPMPFTSAGEGCVSRRTMVLGLAAGFAGCSKNRQPTTTLLNVSYDPTRELYREVNRAFAESRWRRHGQRVSVKQSHGGSSSQARALIDGLPGDIATLATWFDIDALRRDGLVADHWESRLPHRSVPFFSTIVFVVRKGNPKGIRLWDDLNRPDVQVVTPNPKTGGNGKLSFLAMWGSIIFRGGDSAQAEAFIASVYRNVSVLDASARAATATFSQKRLGDVHLTWENEAILEVAEAKGELEIVYPALSVRAEPPATLVDATVDRRNSRELAQAYLEFLFEPEAQKIGARHGFRPTDPTVLQAHQTRFPRMELFQVEQIAKSWHSAQKQFFDDGGVFDRIYSR